MPGCRSWQEAQGPGIALNRDSLQARGLLFDLVLLPNGGAVNLVTGRVMSKVGAGTSSVTTNGTAYTSAATDSYLLDSSIVLAAKPDITVEVSNTAQASAVFTLGNNDHPDRISLHLTVGTSIYWDFGNINNTQGRLSVDATSYIGVPTVWSMTGGQTAGLGIWGNGISLASSAAGAGTGPSITSSGLYVGAAPYINNYYGESGKMTRFRVYNRVRSAAEIWHSYDIRTRYDLYWRKSRSAPKKAAAGGSSVFSLAHIYRHVAGLGA